MATADHPNASFTFFLDTHFGKDQDHFIKNQTRYPVIEIDAGCEASSFLQMVDHVTKQPLSDETIVYLLEDDYLHRERWMAILQEGLSLPDADYVTLFDDRDKYFLPQYKDEKFQLFHTKSCHWRTAPSTTNTYATRFATLKKHLPIHRKYSLDRQISSDYDKFCELELIGATLVSPLPGWSTHVEPKNTSPCYDWERLLVSPKKNRLGNLIWKKQKEAAQ